ncbi:hypothetical protein K9N68_37640 (plasmid) [Kovacikia minuta CCNUW1]|uniref:hypothetical protein n=1 Tax=Kovacikia minuta TaxID=2931930 RepID=UPI001CCBE5D8|nr:hypothetical protein [Kovacikia minuta]UBF29937.1 hypothetical protein K9N68_37640 [Kovacikia minuta CCNUW1]
MSSLQIKPVVLAIDPGSTHSALIEWDGERVRSKTLEANQNICNFLHSFNSRLSHHSSTSQHHLVIEQVKLYQTADSNVHDTILWTGRFIESWYRGGNSFNPVLIPRATIKAGLVHSAQATDAQINAYLKDRFGCSTSRKDPHPITGGLSVTIDGKSKSDLWQALALAVYYFDNLNISIPDKIQAKLDT